eukprot:3971111-Alexandrium_andersonii.AAC.1
MSANQRSEPKIALRCASSRPAPKVYRQMCTKRCKRLRQQFAAVCNGVLRGLPGGATTPRTE